jgi:hypothetical protein
MIVMDPDTRRIIAVDAHRRRTGRCPVIVHSLGTGEKFEIGQTQDGFIDVETGLSIRVAESGLRLPHGRTIDLYMIGDIGFAGYDYSSAERFTGRASGGASITVYDKDEADFVQYAVGEDEVIVAV